MTDKPSPIGSGGAVEHTYARPVMDAAYEVTPNGRVFSIAHNWRGYGRREMRQALNADGYPSVRLTINGKRRRFAVHRLVALAYLSPRPSEQHEIRHLDGDKINNHAANLAWGTRQDNAADRERHGRTSRGPTHSHAIRKGIQSSANPYWRHARQEMADV